MVGEETGYKGRNTNGRGRDGVEGMKRQIGSLIITNQFIWGIPP